MTTPRKPKTTGLLSRLRTPRASIPDHGIEPVIPDIDVPAIIQKLADHAQRAALQTAQAFDADATSDWHQYSRQLSSRIRAQRRELAQLHKKLRAFRAGVHERDELLTQLRDALADTNAAAELRAAGHTQLLRDLDELTPFYHRRAGMAVGTTSHRNLAQKEI